VAESRLQYGRRFGGGCLLLLVLEPPRLAHAAPAVVPSNQLAGMRRVVAPRADDELQVARLGSCPAQGPLGVVDGPDRLQTRLAQAIGIQMGLVPAPRAFSPLGVRPLPGPAAVARPGPPQYRPAQAHLA